MTFDELSDAGRRLARDEEQLRRELRPLVTDPRFAALVGLIEARRDAWRATGETQSMVAHHPQMAHCAGSAFALTSLLEEMRGLWEQPQTEH